VIRRITRISMVRARRLIFFLRERMWTNEDRERSELMVLARDLFSRGSVLAALLILPIRRGGNIQHARGSQRTGAVSSCNSGGTANALDGYTIFPPCGVGTARSIASIER
jgi:hypothetical protein